MTCIEFLRHFFSLEFRILESEFRFHNLSTAEFIKKNSDRNLWNQKRNQNSAFDGGPRNWNQKLEFPTKFDAKEGLRAIDSSWDLATYRVTPLQCLPHQTYLQDMAKLGVVDIALELLREMSDQSMHRQQFNIGAMQKVANHMNLKACEDAQPSQVNSMASALMVNTHTTDGNQSLRSITSMQVESDLGRACKEFHMLAV
jgi:hypothetical protein